MNFFNYKPSTDDQLGKVWELFEVMGNSAKEESEPASIHSYAHTMEIIRSALAGNIALDEESIKSFNLRGYEYACRNNEKIDRRKKVDRELFIVDTSTESKDERVGFGDISESKLKYYDSMFDELLKNSSFEQNVLKLCQIRDNYIVNDGFDPVMLLSGALRGIKEASEMLIEVVKEDKKLAEIIEGICDFGNHDAILSRLSTVGGV